MVIKNETQLQIKPICVSCIFSACLSCSAISLFLLTKKKHGRIQTHALLYMRYKKKETTLTPNSVLTSHKGFFPNCVYTAENI